MTEEEWAVCGDPGAMLAVARPTASDRTMRLFAAACWYRTWSEHANAAERALVELFVGHVDGTVPAHDWFEGFTAAGAATRGKPVGLLMCTDALLAAGESAKYAAQNVAWQRAWDAVEVDVHAPLGERAGQANRRSDFHNRAFATEQGAHAALVREVFGNPLRPPAFSAEWRTDTAVSLARQMYESREFSAMPILADALQDAGCDVEEVLSHCREPGEHVRGCWALDLVLGKG